MKKKSLWAENPYRNVAIKSHSVFRDFSSTKFATEETDGVRLWYCLTKSLIYLEYFSIEMKTEFSLHR